MKVRDLIDCLRRFDPDAHVGVQCVTGDEQWIHTQIAVESNGFGVGAEIAIVRTDTDTVHGAFRAPGATP